MVEFSLTVYCLVNSERIKFLLEIAVAYLA